MVPVVNVVHSLELQKKEKKVLTAYQYDINI